MTEAAGSDAPARELGWWRPVLALMALLFVPAMPLVNLVLPLESTFVLVAPMIAVCTIAGWRSGGRLSLAVLWTVLALFVLWQGGQAGTFDLLTFGWTLVLAAAFGAMLLVPTGPTFLPRALLALVAALAAGTVLILLAPGGAEGAAEVFADEIARRADLSMAQWRALSGTAEWQEMLRENPDASRFGELLEQRLAEFPGVGRRLVPSLLALESLAAMAVAWAFYHRVGRVRLGPPLARLREMRFDDALVWGVVAGLVIVVLPFTGIVRSAGINLLVFFGALYAVRGLGVITWFLAPGRWLTVVLVVFTVVFLWVVASVAAAVGLADTWFDWRREKASRQRSQRSE